MQLADQTRVQERDQANRVDVVWQHIDPSALLLGDEFANVDSMLVIVNNSKRPVRRAACKIQQTPIGLSPQPKRLADRGGELRPYPPSRSQDTFIWVGDSTVPVIKAGARGGFIWLSVEGSDANFFRFWVRFTDDAGLDWEIDTNLHLEKLAQRDW